MDIRLLIHNSKKYLAVPGILETIFAFTLTVLDIFFVDHEGTIPLLAIFGGVRIVLVSISAFLPIIATVLVPASYLAFAFLPNEQAPLQIFCALLTVEVMRSVGRTRLARVMAIALWVISNYDINQDTFARDFVATAITTVLFLTFYGIGAMRHNNKKQAEIAQQEATKALHQQRLELATFLHDSIAKSFTRVTMQSQSLAIEFEDENRRLSDNLNDIAETSREGLLQLRQLLALLKTNDDGDEQALSSAIGQDEPIPTVDKVLDQARQELEETGFTVSLESTITEHPTLSQISEVISPAMSEVCTNIEKYGTPGSAVTIAAAGDRAVGYTITVTNRIAEDSPQTLPRTVLSSGFGLSALRRRTRLLAGSVETAEKDGLWTTTITLAPSRK
nr:histidine kinase [Corynebacterium lactis]